MSMLRNLATSLINARDERIITTLPKAKELRSYVERIITLSRRAQNFEGDDKAAQAAQAVHLRRQAAGFFHAGNRQQAASTGKRGGARSERTAGVAAVKRLFDELGERYKDRPGGYTRIIKLGRRVGDNAELAIIELVDNARERQAVESDKKRKASPGAAKKSAKASKSGEAEGGRRGGRKADKTFEKEGTTKARGGGRTPEPKDADKAGSGGRRSKKTEQTAAEQESD
jgi:large subunit ribosomal protein L17